MRPLKIGDVVIVRLPRQIPSGHEQMGVRPAIVVGLPQIIGKPRYSMVIIVPLTTVIGDWRKGQPDLYPPLAAGVGGLTQSCVALLDQVRSIDTNRMDRYIGSLTPQQFAPIATGMKRLFGF